MTKDEMFKYIADLEREHKRTDKVLRGRKPKITRMQSPRMRAVESQTSNPIKAIYGKDFVGTPIRKNDKGLTKNIGGNCEDRNAPTGKDTSSYKKEK